MHTSRNRSWLHIGDVICVCKQPLFFGEVLPLTVNALIYTTTHSQSSEENVKIL